MKKLCLSMLSITLLLSVSGFTVACNVERQPQSTQPTTIPIDEPPNPRALPGAGPTPAAIGDGTPQPNAQAPTPINYVSDGAFIELALNHVSSTYGVPKERLHVETGEIASKQYPLTGVAIKYAKVLDLVTIEAYLIAVDTTGQVRDFNELETAEKAASWTKFGKLDPNLIEFLKGKGPDELTNVNIWVRAPDVDAIVHQIAVKFPEARLKGISPSDETPLEMYQKVVLPEYQRALREAHLAASSPLAQWLRDRGYQATSVESAPIVVAVVPKSVIAEIGARDDTTGVFLVVMPTPAMNSAGPTLSAPSSWQRGITGSGIKVGIVDVGTVDPQNPYLGVQVANASPADEHSAGVAGAAGSLHPLYLGAAHGISGALGSRSTDIVSAGYTGTTIYAATDAAVNAGARIVNLSWGNWNQGQWMEWDTYYDYRVRNDRLSVIAAAGNTSSEHVMSPGKGYNVLTVGGLIDGNTQGWWADSMWGSSFMNPLVKNNEKPELVAIADSVKTTSNQPAQSWLQDMSGTSPATPQISGGAALLYQRDPTLAYWPEAVKAVLMASAIHNIEGDARLSDRDGVGAPVFGVADTIASTASRAVQFLDMNNDFPGGWYQNYYEFNANMGQRVRAVIVWDSAIVWNPPGDIQDELKTDLDLHVYQLVGGVEQEPHYYSLSVSNNSEIVDFYAPATGTYRLKVRKWSSTENTNYLGIAWTSVDRLWAETFLGQETDDPADGRSAIIVPVDVHYATEPQVASDQNQFASIPGGIEAYGSRVTYWPSGGPHDPIAVLDVHGGESPFHLSPNMYERPANVKPRLYESAAFSGLPYMGLAYAFRQIALSARSVLSGHMYSPLFRA